MTLAEFWNATLREIFMVIDAETRRQRRLWRLHIASGWAAARLVRSDDIPDLNDLAPLETEDDAEPLDDEIQLLMWKAWATAHNASVEQEQN